MQNIAIVYGGYSKERIVSLKSAQTIADNIDKSLYMPYLIEVSEFEWLVKFNNKEYNVNKNDFSFELNEDKRINFDCIYNIIHGAPGENGQLQAYWDMLNIPYTGSHYYTSALTFNKKDCIAVLNKYDIKSAKSFYLKKGNLVNLNSIAEQVGFPCFVKPNESGSSFGISKVHKKEDLPKALEIAFAVDNDILIESFLDGTEVSVGVIRYKGEVVITGITEIVSENEFFDYEAKYAGKSTEITPARISEEEKEKVEQASQQIYSVLNINGISRSEFILVDKEPFFLEINTVPGFSNESILPQQLKSKNISIESFITDQIQSAIKSHTHE